MMNSPAPSFLSQNKLAALEPDAQSALANPKNSTASENVACPCELLLFQLGPVQDFIAQARSTRDLWSGSYMLSWLIAHAIKEVVFEGGIKDEDVVFPAMKENPLVLALQKPQAYVESELTLIPNLTNRFLMLVPNGQANKLAAVAEQAIREELTNIGDAVWEWIANHGGKEEWKARWEYQIKAFPQITYAHTAWTSEESWQTAYNRVNRLTAARRNTRDFAQWQPQGDAAVKDSLSGKEECIGDEKFWEKLRKETLFSKASGHCYGAINLIKRLWMHVEDIDEGSDISYVSSKLNFKDKELWRSLRVEDVETIAGRNTDGSYIAVLAMDGDKMGSILSGTETDTTGKEYHTEVSEKLSAYALHSVADIVRKDHHGHLVYAGGDDVLAILPADQAIGCAKALRDAFKAIGKEYGFEASCGIVVGHIHAPLQMLVKEAQRAEQRAKHEYGRAALAISLYKRSGEIIEWGCKWESKALELMADVTALTKAKTLSGRFPYALAALLKPYALDQKKKAPADDKKKAAEDEKEKAAMLEAMPPIIRAEVRHVLSRQGSGLSPKERENLAVQIDTYLATCWTPQPANPNDRDAEPTPARPQDFINLFLTETFINRHSAEV